MSAPAANDHDAQWEAVYREKRSDDLSWFQEHPALSLELIMGAAPARDARIIDVGGGNSRLVDHLLQHGYRHITVLDISSNAIERARSRLGRVADAVRWIVGDVLSMEAADRYDVWHDRALFHFLTEEEQRRQYIEAVTSAVLPQGAIVVATFAPDGPARCSGLEVRRYDEASLAVEFGASFALYDVRREAHRTPWGAEQRFVYAAFRRVADRAPSAPRRSGSRNKQSPSPASGHPPARLRWPSRA